MIPINVSMRAAAPRSASWKQSLVSYPPVLAAYKNYRFLKFAFREGLWQLAWGGSRHAGCLARQAVRTWEVPIPRVGSAKDLGTFLEKQGLEFHEGGHAIYLPPQAALRRLFPAMMGAYPDTAGLKILKDFRRPEDAQYLTGGSRSLVRDRLMGTWHDRMVAANYLYVHGRGPRVWDVCHCRGEDNSFTAYVVDHVQGTAPGRETWQQFINWLERQVEGDLLRVLTPNWKQHEDFVAPGCNGNLVAGGGDRAEYVDFQNFGLTSQSKWLKQIAADARQTVHFGEGRALRGEHYLYQSIPGLGEAGKRNTGKRWLFLSEQLRRAGIEVKDRLVLDVGCNSGMMLQAALVDGAAWCLGWDRPEVARHTEKLLLGLGRSRFHVFGRELSPQYALEADVPESCRSQLPEAILFYLSVHQHIGVLESLGSLPWRALVFEGHQGESIEDVERLVAPLAERGASVASRQLRGDGDSSPRPLVILTRPAVAAARPCVANADDRQPG